MARVDLGKISPAKAPDQTLETDTPAPEPAITNPDPEPTGAKRRPARQTKAASPRPQASTPTRNDEPSAETASKGVPFHLPASLDERLSAYMQKTGKSHHRVLLEAIARTYPQLPDLIRTAMSGEDADEPEADEVTALFDLPDWSAPRTSQEPRVKHTVRVSPTNRQKLEDIRREVGAPSRNLLIVTAYKAFLPPINES